MSAAEHEEEMPIPPDPAEEDLRNDVRFIDGLLFQAARAGSFSEAAWPLGVALGSMHRHRERTLSNSLMIDLMGTWVVLSQVGAHWPDVPPTWLIDMLAGCAGLLKWGGREASREDRLLIHRRTKRLWMQTQISDLSDLLGENSFEARNAAIASGKVIEIRPCRLRELSNG